MKKNKGGKKKSGHSKYWLKANAGVTRAEKLSVDADSMLWTLEDDFTELEQQLDIDPRLILGDIVLTVKHLSKLTEIWNTAGRMYANTADDDVRFALEGLVTYGAAGFMPTVVSDFAKKAPAIITAIKDLSVWIEKSNKDYATFKALVPKSVSRGRAKGGKKKPPKAKGQYKKIDKRTGEIHDNVRHKFLPLREITKPKSD